MPKKIISLITFVLIFCVLSASGQKLPDKARLSSQSFLNNLIPDSDNRLKNIEINPDTELEFIGSCFWSQAKDIWADDSYLFVLFNNTLVIYHMYYYAEPEYFYHVYFPGAAKSFFRSGDNFYIAAGYEGLFIIDVAMTTEDPHIAGHYNTPGFAQEVVVSGTNAYIADGDGGLQIIDVTVPEHPFYLGSYTQLDYTANVDINGTTAYVSDTLNSLHIVMVSDPTFTIQLGSYVSPSRIYDLAVVDTLVFLGTEITDGFQIIDVSQSNNPVWLSSYGVTGIITTLFIQDSLAFFPDGDGYFQIININDPENPAFVGKIYQCGGVYGFEQKLYVHRFTLLSIYVGLEGCSGACIIDIYNPASPSYVGTLTYCDMPVDAAVQGNLLYVASYYGGLQIFNINNPGSPYYLGGHNSVGYDLNVKIRDTIAYVAAGFKGLVVYDVSDPTQPEILSTPLSDQVAWSSAVVIRDDLAFLTAGYGNMGGLCIVDISNLEDISIISRYPKGASDIVINDGLAYVTDYYNGMYIVNISDPNNPTEIGTYSLTGHTYLIQVADTLAFITNDSGLYIADISEPANVTTLYLYWTPGRAAGIAVRGNLAYVTDDVYGLQVLDVSDPTAPVLLGGYNSPAYATRVTLEDSLIILADLYSIIILDDPFYTPCCKGYRGNADCSVEEEPDISDITRLIDYLYLTHEPLCCLEETDCDGSSGQPDISDITALISYLYISHEPLALCP